jgi:hypothetical protein
MVAISADGLIMLRASGLLTIGDAGKCGAGDLPLQHTPNSLDLFAVWQAVH